MAHEDAPSAIERLLGFEFVSDPRKARFPLPEIPKGHPKDMPFPYPAQEITPEMAEDILKYRVIRLERMPKRLKHDKMTSNRSFLMAALKGSRTNKGLIRTIQDNEWNPRIASPMVFTREGFLLDGQHRGAATFLAKKAIQVPVTVNGQWDTFSVTDTGRGRNAGQLLGDVPYAHYCAAAAKLILPAVFECETTHWQVADATNQEIYDLVHGWPFFHESGPKGQGGWMKEVVGASASRIPLTALAASTMMALAAGADPFHVQSFLDGLKPGYSGGFPDIGEKGKDPRFLLRRKYLRASNNAKSVTDVERRQQVGHVRRAMQIWLDYQGGFGLTELKNLPSVPENGRLPEVWRADAVREFHREKVS
ncbi:hypothetical protein ACFW2V_13975 [Streptomyces sp. NPDC058947]|uniref:hypothetical protein n=1 Tax=Streptomyces sp. NPDC058947 TaxID=3346675 RepID=UPI0036AFA4BF